MKRTALALFSITLLLLGCGISNEIPITENTYRFVDDYRAIDIEFHKNGMCACDISGRGGGLDRSFASKGKWEYILANKVLICLPYDDDTTIMKNIKMIVGQENGQPNKEFDWLYIREIDNYNPVFPVLYYDTITFEQTNKRLSIKGFEFKRTKYKHSYEYN
ncbi:MAG: hypothetical protein IPH84_10540 [Bacteroidales bacterium]|nr:hypothetical protein [Bacteroidales bacterium]